ncbi:MAG TPA: glutathione S-transferase family protein [Candidatus Limnocylindrales bacterium]|nr:glutathione S-transferase family protein [Candidatus Limnocylindrales bacterium]
MPETKVAAGAVELHQFRYSHYNEKARWALDYKRIAHRRIDYLPGPHAFFLPRLSGQRATPVLKVGGKTLAGSAAIVAELERRFPERPLYPADAAARAEALALERRFDEELGPASRRMVYDGMLSTPQYIATMFSQGRPALQRALYLGAMPLIKELMRSGNGVTAESVAQAEKTVGEFLDFIGGKSARTGYLVGGTFTIADLAAAALMSPVLRITHPDVAKPEPMPRRLCEIVARFDSHPAAAWVHEQYRRHRQ